MAVAEICGRLAFPTDDLQPGVLEVVQYLCGFSAAQERALEILRHPDAARFPLVAIALVSEVEVDISLAHAVLDSLPSAGPSLGEGGEIG